MKRLLLFSLFLACFILGFSQGHKFKVVNRTAADSVVSSFTKDAEVIDGSANPQLRSGTSSVPGSISTLQLPAKIHKDSTQVIIVKPAERKPVFIERERSQLRSAQKMSNKEITYAFFKETPELHVNKPEEQIRINQMNTDDLGISHVKGVQLFRKIPVYGMDFTFHISSQNERFMGYTIDPSLIDKGSAKLNAKKAIRIAESDLSKTTEIQSLSSSMKKLLNYDRPTANSIYFPDNSNNYRISYKVIIRPNVRDEWIYYIDAQSGEIIEKYNNTPTADGPTKGTGADVFGVQRTVDTYVENGVHYMVNVTKSMFNPSNFNGKIAIYDQKSNPKSDATLATSSSAQWNHKNAISAMYNISLVFDYLKNTHKRNSFDDKGSDMICIVNMPNEDGSSMDNAYWNGKFIAMGNGKDLFLPTAGALDVIAHEFGHAVVSHTANLEYKNQSGAVNEGYADIFGAMVERQNWTIGETIIKNKSYFPSGSLRDMSNPHNGGKGVQDNCWQPAHVGEMYLGSSDNGGVHVNSGIPNYAFYLYATATSKEKAEKVFYRALCNYLTPTSKFVDFRIGVLAAAKDLYGNADVQLLANAFDKVGIVSEDTEKKPPVDLPTNPGTQGVLLTSTNPRSSYGLYKSTDYPNYTKPLDPVTTSKLYNKPSITDDGKLVFFINTKNVIRGMDIASGEEVSVSTDDGYANVAVSRDGNRLAFVTTQEDAKIYVYDFVSRQMKAFKLYNPTTGTGSVQSGGVKYADAIEFDHSGEYIIYDAYNVVGGSLGGGEVDYWDIGIMNVWDNAAKKFGTGEISKLFSDLEPGVSVGNPTFSKNSPYIIAFDYMDDDEVYATFGANLATGDLDVMFTNNMAAFPNYSMDDKAIAFTSYDDNSGSIFTGYAKLDANKISTTDPLQAAAIAINTAYPVFYGTGNRQLGLKPAAAFSADARSGSAPLKVQFLDLSDNKPTRWSWEFQGGTPSTSTTQNPVIRYNTPGTFKVKLTVYNDYGNDAIEKQSYVTVGNSTGIDPVAQQEITVSPNPAANYVKVQGIGNTAQDLKLLDITGKTIPVSFSNNSEEIRIDVSNLHPGIYFVKIGNKTFKFIKK